MIKNIRSNDYYNLNKITLKKIFYLSKRIVIICIFSLVWLVPLVFYFFIPEINNDIEFNESRLTPKSVSVRGYTRDDGTYVNSYNRRPPGSVIRDKPIEREISRLKTTRNITYILSFISIIGFLYFIIFEISIFNKKINDKIHLEILSKIEFDFNELLNKPSHLVNRKISRFQHSGYYSCFTCKNTINSNDFYYSNLSVRKTTRICLKCMVKSEFKFTDEIFYVNKFKKNMEFFLNQYYQLGKTNYDGYEINSDLVEEFFYQKVKEIRKIN